MFDKDEAFVVMRLEQVCLYRFDRMDRGSQTFTDVLV